MPGSVTSAFSEPEDFEDALRIEGCRSLLITGRGRFRAQLTQIALHRLRLLAAEEQLSRVAFVAVPTDIVATAFRIDSGTAPGRGGTEKRPSAIRILAPGEQIHLRTDGPRRWGAIWFPADDLARYGSAINGAPFQVPIATQHWQLPREADQRLRGLHAAAVRMAATRPQALIDSEAARGLEQELIDAVVEGLSAGSAIEAPPSERRGRDVMARFEHLLQCGQGRVEPMTETCAALGVSQRLLRSLCAQHLGMSPTAYSRRRRMALARRALRHSASISDVAADFGFRNPNRFVVNYRNAFGELPSATLRRANHR